MGTVRRQAYDLDAVWDDPFEPKVEHRAAKRFPTRLRVNISVDVHASGRTLVGPALVENISLSGLCGLTKHDLQPRQRVTVLIPTAGCPPTMCLPTAFMGTAQVVRVKALEDRKQLVALRFESTLLHNIEFAMFIDHLQSLSPLLSTT